MRAVYVDYLRAILRYFALLSVRSGFLYSFVLHIVVMAVALSDVSFLRPKSPSLSEAIPIELVTIAKRTNLPKPKVRTKPRPKREAVAKKSEPKQVAKAKDAVPLPVPPIPKPSSKKEVVKVKPKAKPVPPEEKKAAKFDLGRIAALIDEEKKQRREEKIKKDEPEIKDAPTSRQTQLLDAPLTISEIDAVKMQIRQCWRLPAGATEAESLIVKIRLFLRPDGSLSRQPEIVDAARMTRSGEEYFRTAAESAVRAVLKCEPLRMPSTKYERWREMVLTFDPSEMLGG